MEPLKHALFSPQQVDYIDCFLQVKIQFVDFLLPFSGS